MSSLSFLMKLKVSPEAISFVNCVSVPSMSNSDVNLRDPVPLCFKSCDLSTGKALKLLARQPMHLRFIDLEAVRKLTVRVENAIIIAASINWF